MNFLKINSLQIDISLEVMTLEDEEKHATLSKDQTVQYLYTFAVETDFNNEYLSLLLNIDITSNNLIHYPIY